MNTIPSQLKKIRKEHYDKLYVRQPQLIKRLTSFINKAGIVQENLEEPLTYSPQNPLSKLLEKSEPNGKKEVHVDRRRKLRRDLNKFSNEMKAKKPQNLKSSNIQKISDIRPEILWGMS